MMQPVDPTKTRAWSKISQISDSLDVDFRRWFAEDARRAEKYSYTAGDLYADLSKTYLTDSLKDELVRLAEEVGVFSRRDAMFNGERINVTENRSVLHTALRRPSTDELVVDLSLIHI